VKDSFSHFYGYSTFGHGSSLYGIIRRNRDIEEGYHSLDDIRGKKRAPVSVRESARKRTEALALTGTVLLVAGIISVLALSSQAWLGSVMSSIDNLVAFA
jgi:hypothetical protein